MPTLDLTVLGPPLGKGAAQTNRTTGATFNTTRTAEWMGAARMEIAKQLPHDWCPLDEPCVTFATAIFKRPKTGKNRFSYRDRRNDGRTRYAQTPDADNVSKIVCDSMKHAGVWRDDCVTDVYVRRRWQALGEAPRVLVLVVWGADLDRLPWPPDALEDW